MAGRQILFWGALLFSVGLFVLLNIWGVLLTGGVFVYPLDDTYIHLSIAEQIANGEYGINPQAFASAASSIIYPILLLPFVGSDLQQYVPLLLNAAALLWGLFLIERILSRCGFLANKTMQSLMLLILLIAPVSMNMIGVAMLGMEQILHVLTVLFAIYGVVLWHEEKRVNAYLIAAILIGPLLRYEAMGLSLLLSFMIFIEGKKPAGAALALAAILPLIGFSWFLYANDGSLLPNSVIRKVILAKAAGGEEASLLLKNFNGGDYELMAWIFLGFAAVFGALLMLPSIRRDRLALRLGLIAIASLIGQVFIGRNGWGNRHETYVIVLSVLAFIIVVRGLLQTENGSARVASLMIIFVLLFPLPHFAKQMITFGPLSMRNVFDQQWQVARFARDYVKAPIAVNDIGLPSFQNENTVVDLWGLASSPALNAWADEKPRGWANDLVNQAGADLAMVYEGWVLPAVGPGWYKIGYLKIRGEPYSIAGPWVSFYATNQSAISKLQNLMRDFQQSLPNPEMLEIFAIAEAYIPNIEVTQ